MRRICALAIRVGVAAAVAMLLSGPLRAAEDHPLVSRYPESKIDKHEVRDFDTYKLVVGLDVKEMAFDGKAVEGKFTRIAYTNPRDRSTLEIFRNYRQALVDAGAEILYECELDACGPAFARSAWARFNGLFAASDGDPRYLAAHIAKGDVQAYIALMIGKQRTQLDVVEVKPMDTGLVAVDPAALARDLEKSGSVRIYGIYFDVDKADIRSESKPALDAIAGLLKAQPSLSIFIVGHTDSTGALNHNMQLSTARARAVVAALTKDYAIAAARLDPHGVGPLAPVAPNTTDEGRQLNRRVELVAR
jgi:outer membrane protein OmpA-like peptidoglycan-associated protein